VRIVSTGVTSPLITNVLGIGARRIEITEEHKVFHASTVYFRAGNTQSRRHASIGPGAAYYHDKAWADQHTSSPLQRNLEETTTLGHDVPSSRNHAERRLSVDNSFFQRSPLFHEEFPVASIPPYSPSATQPSPQLPPSNPEIIENHPLQPLEEYADYFDSDLRTGSRQLLPCQLCIIT
jgi:arrestin-related trafficking adapter 3/6